MVLVNLYHEPVGAPMAYRAAKRFFDRLASQCGFPVRPYMLRHTAATGGRPLSWTLDRPDVPDESLPRANQDTRPITRKSPSSSKSLDTHRAVSAESPITRSAAAHRCRTSGSAKISASRPGRLTLPPTAPARPHDQRQMRAQDEAAG
jgi:hypothetical protein